MQQKSTYQAIGASTCSRVLLLRSIPFVFLYLHFPPLFLKDLDNYTFVNKYIG